MTGPRILIYDIENSPALGYFWPPGYDTNIIDIKEEWYLLSFAYKWADEPDSEIKFERKGPKKGDDKALAKKLWQLYDEADAVMAHNGDRFDQKKAWTRMLYHGLGPSSPYIQIDTLKLLRQKFALSSNRLDSAARFLGIGEKLPNQGIHTWKGCMANDEESWQVMERYNKHDVVLLAGLYERIAPYVKTRLNMQAWSGTYSCVSCGSRRLMSRGYRSKGGIERTHHNWQCKDCNHWSYELLTGEGKMRTI